MSEKSEGIVTVITGASRGLGRGIALALGSKGATVYVTGRTLAADQPRAAGEAVLPGTIHDAAAAVTAAGGRGIAVACDAGDDAQLAALFERVERESGRLDILVNNAAYIDNALLAESPFFEKPLALSNILDVGLRCHYVASWHAARILARQKRGLIVNVSFFGAVSYFHGPAYGASKAGLDKMAADMAVDLKPFNVAAVSVWPGLIATERVLALAEQMPELKQQLAGFESPAFSGDVIDALYRDPKLMELSGKTLIIAELAQRYGLTEADGRQPHSLRAVMGAPHPNFEA
jgi:NAD(P)-dependent dehydrogenase (short-subunit alcohol dehydrogenase family)